MGGDSLFQESVPGDDLARSGAMQLAAADVLPVQFGRNGNQQSSDSGPLLGRWPESAPSIIDLGKPAVEQRTEVPSPEKKFEAPKIINGVMELSYNDVDFEKKLMSTDKFDTIRIKELPPGVSIQHWLDEGGYFMYFKGPAGTRSDWIHYPPNARTLSVVDKGSLDLYAERLRVNDNYADTHHGGFKSLQRESEVLSYLANMSTFSDRHLAIQENSLRTSSEWSGNPYFKIFLADVMAARTMKPIVRQLQDKQMPNIFDRESIARMEFANKDLQIAERESKNSLREWPNRPVVTPLGHRQPDAYQFFLGAMTQSRVRMGKVNELRQSIQGNRVPSFDVPTRRID
jgi:hypothetical protein